jgi:hypothetical protein
MWLKAQVSNLESLGSEPSVLPIRLAFNLSQVRYELHATLQFWRLLPRSEDGPKLAESTASKQMPRRDTIRFPTGHSPPDWLTLQIGGTRSVLIHKLSRAPAAFKAAAVP